MTERIRSSKGMVALVVLAVAVIATGGLVLHHEMKPYHFVTVTPDVLYRSGSLTNHNLNKVVDEYGIRTVVALRLQDETGFMPEWYKDEKELCEGKGIEFVHIPMMTDTPPTAEMLETWLDLLDHPENHPILVHCAQGVVRTGMLVAVYEIEYLRKDNRETLVELPMFGHELFVERRKPMVDFILNYEPRWRRANSPESPED